MEELPYTTAYELQGVVEEKDENDEWYSNRETVLSYNQEDAGNISMQISEATPLMTREDILFTLSDIEEKVNEENSEEEWKEKFLQFKLELVKLLVENPEEQSILNLGQLE